VSFANSDLKDIVLGDSEIRSLLRSRLSPKPTDRSRTILIEELVLCRGLVRVDLSVVNGRLHGYEIKSDRDSLRRLAAQAEIYGKVFDRATLVVGERHLAQARQGVPDWWGILLVRRSTNGLQLKTVRSPRNNPQKDPRALVELLWRDAAMALLEKLDAATGVRGKPRWMAWDRICTVCGVEEIGAAVRAQLKARAKKRVPV